MSSLTFTEVFDLERAQAVDHQFRRPVHLARFVPFCQ